MDRYEQSLMDQSGEQEPSQTLPPEMWSALEANSDLRDVLQKSELPRRFQAMVLGLATLQQENPKRRR